MYTTDPADSRPIDLSILIPARKAEHCLEETCARLHEATSSYRDPGSFEILIASNVGAYDADGTPGLAADIASRFDEVVALDTPGLPGKGAALKWGTKMARGRVIAFVDADLPFEPEFLERASRAVEGGADLAVANRRLAESRLNLPRSPLSPGFRRHLLGRAFNRVVRALLPIEGTDTQAGAKAMSRRLAREAFDRVVCPGFLFDIELFLCAAGAGLRVVDLPVTMCHRADKSTVSVIRLAANVAYWLARIMLRSLLGAYSGARFVTGVNMETETTT